MKGKNPLSRSCISEGYSSWFWSLCYGTRMGGQILFDPYARYESPYSCHPTREKDEKWWNSFFIPSFLVTLEPIWFFHLIWILKSRQKKKYLKSSMADKHVKKVSLFLVFKIFIGKHFQYGFSLRVLWLLKFTYSFKSHVMILLFLKSHFVNKLCLELLIELFAEARISFHLVVHEAKVWFVKAMTTFLLLGLADFSAKGNNKSFSLG